MRFLVLGSSDFLAVSTLETLKKTAHEFVYYGKWRPGFVVPEGVEATFGTLDELPFRKSEFGLEEFDAVICLNCGSEQDSRCVLESFWNIGKSFVVVSSGNVYRAHGRLRGTEPGEMDLAGIPEDSPLRGRFLDRETHLDKRFVEKTFLRSGRSVTILRLPPLYGEGDRRARFYPLMRRMIDGRKEIPLGTLQSAWKWTHGYVGDMAYAIVLAAVNGGGKVRTYNVGEADPPSVSERIKDIATILEWEGQIVLTPDPMLAEHLRPKFNFAQPIVYDTTRIRDELGYREKFDYEAALMRSVQWYAQHPPSEIVGIDYCYDLEDEFLDQVRE